MAMFCYHVSEAPGGRFKTFFQLIVHCHFVSFYPKGRSVCDFCFSSFKIKQHMTFNNSLMTVMRQHLKKIQLSVSLLSHCSDSEVWVTRETTQRLPVLTKIPPQMHKVMLPSDSAYCCKVLLLNFFIVVSIWEIILFTQKFATSITSFIDAKESVGFYPFEIVH
jgi:hypothetical protein